MPWTAAEFAKKHNSKLKGAAASKAAEMATAMVKDGVPESIAIATANKHGNSMQRRHDLYDHPRSRKGYADGGQVMETNSASDAAQQSYANARLMAGEKASGEIAKQAAAEASAKSIQAEQDARNAEATRLGHSIQVGSTTYFPQKGNGHAKGGAVRRTSGKPVGRNDGMIPAQKGEFVVKKSAVKKLGEAALEEINKGHLPRHRMLYDHPTSRKKSE